MKYLIFMQDEYNNNYYIGVFNKLNNAIPKINEFLEPYETQIDELNAYPSTYGMCFDREIETSNEEVVWLRGFILDDDKIKPLD